MSHSLRLGVQLGLLLALLGLAWGCQSKMPPAFTKDEVARVEGESFSLSDYIQLRRVLKTSDRALLLEVGTTSLAIAKVFSPVKPKTKVDWVNLVLQSKAWRGSDAASARAKADLQALGMNPQSSAEDLHRVFQKAAENITISVNHRLLDQL